MCTCGRHHSGDPYNVCTEKHAFEKRVFVNHSTVSSKHGLMDCLFKNLEDRIGRPGDSAGIAYKGHEGWEFIFVAHYRDVLNEPAAQRLHGNLEFSWGFRCLGG